MSGYSIEEQLEAILLWNDNNREYNFDTSFIESMQERLGHGEELTQGQTNAIETILIKWGIEPGDWV